MSELKQVVFTPPGPVSKAFLNSNAFVSCLMGPYGTGKTTTAAAALMRNITETKPDSDGVVRWTGVCMRKTNQKLLANMIPTFEKILPKGVTKDRMSSPITKVLEVKGKLEATIYFIPVDDEKSVDRILGLNLNFFYADECRETTFNVLADCIARVRVRNDMGEEQPLRCIFTTNPPSTRNWVYEKFVDPETKVDGWEFFKQASGLDYENRENAEHLGKNYYEDLVSMHSPSWAQAHVHGEFTDEVLGEAICPDFRPAIHVANEEIQYSPTIPLICSADAGPTLNSCILVGQNVPLVENEKIVGNQLRVLHEIYCENMGAVRAAEYVKENIHQCFPGLNVDQVIGDPAMFEQRECGNERVFSEIWQGVTGFNFRKAPTNLVHLRVEALRGLFQKLINGQPAVLISPNCKKLIAALASEYRWKTITTKSGSQVTKDVIDKENSPYDDYGDAMGYMSLGIGGYKTLKDTARKGRYKNGYSGPIIVPGVDRSDFYNDLYGED